jgi:hypothetical protein
VCVPHADFKGKMNMNEIAPDPGLEIAAQHHLAVCAVARAQQ